MSTALVPIISVYDGAKCLGHIRERDREHIARTWPGEVLIGSFKSRREAADAITAAHRQARPRTGAGMIGAKPPRG